MQLVGHLYIHTFARKNENKDILGSEYKVSEVRTFRTDFVKYPEKYIDSKLCFHYGDCLFCRSFRLLRLIRTQISRFIPPDYLPLMCRTTYYLLLSARQPLQ